MVEMNSDLHRLLMVSGKTNSINLPHQPHNLQEGGLDPTFVVGPSLLRRCFYNTGCLFAAAQAAG
jgi:hypothetical protein